MSRNTHAASTQEPRIQDIGPGAAPPPLARFDAVSTVDNGAGAALRGLSFALPPGSLHILTGNAGSGKTSLIGLIQAAAAPARGRIELFGRDVASLRAGERPLVRARIGLISTAPVFLDHLSVFDNAALAPRLAGRKQQAYGGEVAQLLAWVGLGKRMAAHPADLTPGERRRLALARAVANRPDILLADAPASDVDAATADRVTRLLVELNTAGTTVLIATDDEGLAARLGQPVMRLRGGRLTRIDDTPGIAAWGSAAP